MTATPPRPTKAQRALLDRIASGDVYVYRDPATLGGGVNPATYQAARQAGWITLGAAVPLKGRKLALTDAGRAARERSTA
jgi:hypothetical protein